MPMPDFQLGDPFHFFFFTKEVNYYIEIVVIKTLKNQILIK